MQNIKFEIKKKPGGVEDEDDFVAVFSVAPDFSGELTQADLHDIAEALKEISVDIERTRMGGIFAPNVHILCDKNTET